MSKIDPWLAQSPQEAIEAEIAESTPAETVSPAAEDAFENACFTCDMVMEVEDKAGSFIKALNAAMLDPMVVIMGGLFALWCTVTGAKMFLGQVRLDRVSADLVLFFVASLFLNATALGIVEGIYTIALKVMSGASDLVMSVATEPMETVPKTPAKYTDGMVRLVWSAEKAVKSVLIAAMKLQDKAMLIALPLIWFLILGLFAPYFLMLLAYFAQISIAIFRVLVLASLTPFLIVSSGFPWSRNMLGAGVRALLGTVIVLYSATLTIGLTMYFLSLIVTPEMLTQIGGSPVQTKPQTV